MLFISFFNPFLPYLSILPAQLISPLTAEERGKKTGFGATSRKRRRPQTGLSWTGDLESWTLVTSGHWAVHDSIAHKGVRVHCT